MTTAIDTLNSELAEAENDLTKLHERWDTTIEQGRSAARIVSDKAAEVVALKEAIGVLEQHEENKVAREKQREAQGQKRVD